MLACSVRDLPLGAACPLSRLPEAADLLQVYFFLFPAVRFHRSSNSSEGGALKQRQSAVDPSGLVVDLTGTLQAHSASVFTGYVCQSSFSFC